MGEVARAVVRRAPAAGVGARRSRTRGEALAVELTSRALRYIERYEPTRG